MAACVGLLLGEGLVDQVEFEVLNWLGVLALGFALLLGGFALMIVVEVLVLLDFVEV